MFITYLVMDEQTGKFTMCSDELSMKQFCKNLRQNSIGYEVQKHEVEDLMEMVAGKVFPKITIIEKWTP